MKKLSNYLSKLILTLIVICSCFTFVSCDKEHTHNYTNEVTAPTCTEQGYTTHTCSDCGYSFIDNFTQPINHNYGSWVSNNNGTHTHTCSNNASHTETQNCNYETSVVLPTCKNQGYTLYTCQNCGYTYKDNYTNPIAHKYENGICTECGESEIYNATFIVDNEIIKIVPFTTQTTELEEPDVPEKKGYTGKWSDYVLENKNITIKANYTIITYNITYVLPSGIENNENNANFYTVESGILSLYQPKTTFEYSFDGWYTSNSFDSSTKLISINSSFAKDLTLYAKIVSHKIESADGFEINYTDYEIPTLTATVSSSKTIMTLSNIIKVSEGCSWILSTDIEGKNKIETKNLSLATGHNNAYITVSYANEYNSVYYLDIYKLKIKTYSFISESDVYIEETEIEELSQLQEPTAPTKDGYIFVGWTENLDVLVPEIVNFPYIVTKNIVFYAVFSNNSFIITYDVNGGDSLETNTQRCFYDIETTLVLPTRTGYTFGGWYYGDTLVENGVWKIAEDITLVANWLAIKYYINYENNGGVNNNENPAEYTIESNTIILQSPTKTGYDFGGWYRESTFRTKVETIQSGSHENIDLYAKWTPIVYTVTYNLNGGTNSLNNPKTFIIEDETKFFQDPTKTGYDFAGWFSESTFNSRVDRIYSGSHENIVLYAKWTPTIYDLTYYLDNGTNNSNNPETYTIETPTITLQNPSKIGYDFAGWYRTETFSNKITQIQIGTHENIKLYAKWTPIVYTITYNLNGGTNNSNNPKTFIIEDETIVLSDATKTGYQFAGWFSDNGFNNIVTEITKGTAENKTLYAKFLLIYTITYELDGGTNDSNNPSTYTIETETIILLNATKENLYFAGWFTENSFENQVTEIAKGTTGNIKLYAKWSEKLAYVLKNDGTIDFGSYPQTKVTDSSLISSLTSLAGTKPTSSNSGTWTSYKYYINGSNTTDFMWYKDVSYNGEKYRAIYFTSYRPNYTSYSSSTGNTYQDDNGYYTNTLYFFKFEPVNWRILTQSNGKAFLMCNMIIDIQEYYDNYNTRTIDGKTVYANNYAESNIRKWLNNNFYNTAFSALEKQIIELTNVDNSARSTNSNNNETQFNNGNNSYACENTNDYVFLLSEQEVTNSAYGFNSSYSAYDTARQMKATDYAKSQGKSVSTSSGYEGKGWWWLRSPYDSDYRSARYVGGDGSAGYKCGVSYTDGGIVPALWITLAEPEEPFEPENTYVLKSDGTIDFGSYPQTKVTDSSLISSLTSLAGTKPISSNSGTWTSYKYYISSSNTTDFMWYKDISYGGNKYRAVYFTSYRPYWISDSSSTNSYQDDNGYNTNTLYFFKFESVNWRILTQSNGKALLMCNMIIDSQEYYNSTSIRTINGKTIYANNYAESNIRKWLNDNFYNTAFSELEKQIIELTNVDNSARSTNPNSNATQWNSGNNSYACENTNDYVFLLSEQEVTNSAYGFNSSCSDYDTARRMKSSDYAKSQGCYSSTSSSYLGNGCWWLRSPIYDNYYNSWDVDFYGGSSNFNYVYNTSRGVVPALWITI